MHGTSIWPSHIECRGGLPCVRWPQPLQRVQRLRVVHVPVLLLPGRQQRGRPQQQRRVRQKRKAALVASWFVRVLHARPSAVTHANPPNH